MSLSERFRYSSGVEMNGFFISNELTDSELDICFNLVAVGPLGMSIKDINNLDDGIDIIAKLVEDGLIREMTLLELATEITQDEFFSEKIQSMREQGGIMVLEREGDINFFKGFEQAEEIIMRGNIPANSETRYQVKFDFYRYVDLIYDDR